MDVITYPCPNLSEVESTVDAIPSISIYELQGWF